MDSYRTGRIWASAFASVIAAVLAASTSGCAGGSPPATHRHHLTRALTPTADQGTIASRTAPLMHAVAGKLGKGFIYLLAGPSGAWLNLWLISGGTERQLTFGSKDSAISSAGAAPAGIVVSDDLFRADDLAKLTKDGIWWLPTGRSSRLHQGSSATISARGQIAFIAVPHALAYPDSNNFELRIQNGFTAKSTIIYATPKPLLDPVFGPEHQIAFIRQPKAGEFTSATVLLRSADGHVRSVKTDFGFPDNLVWSANAPDLVVQAWPLKAEAISPSGKRTHLPAGWFPVAWNPAGTKLLVSSKTSIGFWNPARPAAVDVIGSLSPGVELGIASWLNRSASLSIPSGSSS